MGFLGGAGDYKAAPTPSIIPGTTAVSSGITADSGVIQAQAERKARQRRGFASTIRNEGGAAGLAGNVTGKSQLGE